MAVTRQLITSAADISNGNIFQQAQCAVSVHRHRNSNLMNSENKVGRKFMCCRISMFMWDKKTVEHMSVHCGGKISSLISSGPLKREMNYTQAFSILSKFLSFTRKVLQNLIVFV